MVVGTKQVRIPKQQSNFIASNISDAGETQKKEIGFGLGKLPFNQL